MTERVQMARFRNKDDVLRFLVHFFGVQKRKLKSYPFGQSYSFGFAKKRCPPPKLRKVYTQMIGVCKLVKAGDHGTQFWVADLLDKE